VNKHNSLIKIEFHPEVVFKIDFKYVRHDKFCKRTCLVWCVVYGLVGNCEWICVSFGVRRW
jgi:hypothetical protein